MTTAVDLLEAVRDALSDPERWMKGDYFEEGATPDTATQCCVYGGLLVASRACGIPCLGPAFEAEMALVSVALRRGTAPATFNDAPTTTHADLLAFLGEAIEEARRRG